MKLKGKSFLFFYLLLGAIGVHLLSCGSSDQKNNVETSTVTSSGTTATSLSSSQLSVESISFKILGERSKRMTLCLADRNRKGVEGETYKFEFVFHFKTFAKYSKQVWSTEVSWITNSDFKGNCWSSNVNKKGDKWDTLSSPKANIKAGNIEKLEVYVSEFNSPSVKTKSVFTDIHFE